MLIYSFVTKTLIQSYADMKLKKILYYILFVISVFVLLATGCSTILDRDMENENREYAFSSISEMEQKIIFEINLTIT